MCKSSKCIVCGEEFKSGDWIQAFLSSPDDPNGSWTKAVQIDDNFQERVVANGNNITRRHYLKNEG